MRQYLELAGLLGAIYVVQTFDAVYTITSGELGTANLPFTIYQTLFTAHDYGLASAQGVIVVLGSILIATFAVRNVSSLLQGRRQMTTTLAPRRATPSRTAPAAAATQEPAGKAALTVLHVGHRHRLHHPGAVYGADQLPLRDRRGVRTRRTSSHR